MSWGDVSYQRIPTGILFWFVCFTSYVPVTTVPSCSRETIKCTCDLQVLFVRYVFALALMAQCGAIVICRQSVTSRHSSGGSNIRSYERSSELSLKCSIQCVHAIHPTKPILSCGFWAMRQKKNTIFRYVLYRNYTPELQYPFLHICELIYIHKISDFTDKYELFSNHDDTIVCN